MLLLLCCALWRGGSSLECSGARLRYRFRRDFVVVCHNVSPLVLRGTFSPNNLLEGRVDVLARCVSAALWLSNGVRADTTLWLALGDDTVEVR